MTEDEIARIHATLLERADHGNQDAERIIAALDRCDTLAERIGVITRHTERLRRVIENKLMDARMRRIKVA